jgi:outer membrane protein TolC
MPRLCLPAIAAGILLVTGCTTYEPKPLDLASHAIEWGERRPGSDEVRALADRLGATPDAPGAFDPDDGLSVDEAELVALVFNADLRLARARAGVAAASAEHAGLWDDPTVSVDVLRITESVSHPWVISPRIAFTIPISGRLEVEKERADAAAHAELHRVAEAEWDVRRAVRTRWSTAFSSRVELEETQRLVERLETIVASTERLVEVGEMDRTEATLFAVELVQRRSELHRLRADVEEIELDLRSLLGLVPDAPLHLDTALWTGEPIDDVDAATMAETNQTLARLRADYDVAEATLEREVRKQYPDLVIGPAYEYDEGQSKIGLGAGLPLPIFNANRQGIAEATAERELARAAFETTYERLAGNLAATQRRRAAYRAQREEMETALVPLVDRQVDDAFQLLALGESGGLVLLESLVRAHTAKTELIELRLREAEAAIAIAHLVGPAPGGDVVATDTEEVNP